MCFKLETYTEYVRFVGGKINTDIVNEQFENLFNHVVNLIWFIICPQNQSNQRTFFWVKNSTARFLDVSEIYVNIMLIYINDD